MSFELINSETVYQGRAFDVRKDRVRLPDGREADWDVVRHRAAVTLLPLDEEGMIWFVNQYRHAVAKEILELPAGVVEANERPEVCAQREIREEIGMAARELHFLGSFFLAPGYSTELMHVYLATHLYPETLDQDEDEVLTVQKLPLEQAYAMAEQGQIEDAKTLAALFLLRPRLSELAQEG